MNERNKILGPTTNPNRGEYIKLLICYYLQRKYFPAYTTPNVAKQNPISFYDHANATNDMNHAVAIANNRGTHQKYTHVNYYKVAS